MAAVNQAEIPSQGTDRAEDMKMRASSFTAEVCCMRRRIRDLARSGLSLVMALMICVSLLPAEAFAREYGGALDSDDAIAEESAARQAGGKFRVAVRSAAPKAAASGAFDWSDDTEMRAKAIWERMSDDEKIGQLFLIQSPGSVSSLGALTDKYHPAGYVLFANDFKNAASMAAFKSEIDELQKASELGLIISVDEEGGNVVRASKYAQYEHVPFKSPQELKADGGLTAVEADAADKATFLKSLGVNLNLAPVADTSIETGKLYSRTWGGSYAENAEYRGRSRARDGKRRHGYGTQAFQLWIQH